ncbi:MAG: NUDIX domain-containing protein [Blastocatellia bacterium]|jgi:ADP-ribose pyrophosphatase YjhB (NUDIX family)|nr:NUDIX domain-containing protein [Blastocatellia bacterium]
MKALLGKVWKKLPSWLRLRIIRTSQHKFTASVVAVIANENGEVLLLEHLLRPASGWGLPGGFLIPYEQPEEGIRRELREETGLELSDVRQLRTRVLRKHIEILFTARSTGDGKVGSSEILQIRWFAIDDLPTELNSDQKSLIREVFRGKV